MTTHQKNHIVLFVAYSIIMLAWLAAVVYGQDATVQVRCHQPTGRIESSGVIVKAIGDKCEVLSAAHSCPTDTSYVEIVFRDGRRAWANKSQLSREKDLVVYSVSVAAKAWRKLGREPFVGQQVIGIGYGQDRRLARLDGMILGSARLGPTESLSAGRNVHVLRTSFCAEYGDSGGPVIDQVGHLVGIMLAGPNPNWPNPDRESRIVSVGQICEVLDACWGGKCRVQQAGFSSSPAPVVVADPPAVAAPQAIQIDLNELARLVAERLPVPSRGLSGSPGKSIVGPPGPPGKSANLLEIAIEGKNGEIVGLIRPDETGRVILPPIRVFVDGVRKTVPLGGDLQLTEKPE